MDLTPRPIEGPTVRLEPLGLEHLDGLCDVGLDPDLWRLTVTRIHDRAGLERYVRTALEEQQAGTALPFATVLRDTGRIIGSTRFGNLSPPNRRVQMGWTWLGRPWQRTGADAKTTLPHAAACVRAVELHPGGVQDQRAEPAPASRRSSGSARARRESFGTT